MYTMISRPYVITSLLVLALFSVLAGLVLFVPIISHWDESLSGWVQSTRFPALDQLMLAVTISGDVFVALSGATGILIYLLFTRNWKLWFQTLTIGISTLVLVVSLKGLTARARPNTLSVGLDSFSFPSGHTCASVVLAGVAAVLIARGRGLNTRLGIYASAALFAVMMGISRVYLHVHWPTDVLAGWLLGYLLVVSFAWCLQSNTTITTHRRAPLILCAVMPMYIIHVFLTWSNKADQYGVILS